MSWQDESNPALLQVLATRAKKIQLSCQLRTTRRKPLNYNKFLFTITAEIHARLLVNFYCQYAHRHMNLKIIRPVSERERAIRQFVIVKLTVSFLCVCPVIDHKFRHHIVNIVKVAVKVADYFDIVMTKFIVNNRTDSLTNDVNLFFTITNGRIARSSSLTRHMNFKFMSLPAY